MSDMSTVDEDFGFSASDDLADQLTVDEVDEINEMFREEFKTQKSEEGTSDTQPKGADRRERVPADYYTITIEKAEVKTISKRDGTTTPIVSWWLRPDGEYNNRIIFKDSFLTKNALPYLIKEMRILGFEFKKPTKKNTFMDQLSVMLGECLGKRVKIRLMYRTVKGEERDFIRTTVYFNEEVGAAVTADPGDWGADGSDEDIPF